MGLVVLGLGVSVQIHAGHFNAGLMVRTRACGERPIRTSAWTLATRGASLEHHLEHAGVGQIT